MCHSPCDVSFDTADSHTALCRTCGGCLRLANLTLYTIVRKICHIKDGINRHAKAADGRPVGHSRAPAPPTRLGKNLHVCVLNLVASVFGHEAFANPQVDGLRDFRLLPLSELKRKRTSFLRAGRSKDARNPPSRAACQTQCPRPYGFPGSTPDTRYLFGATLSSSQVHRKAKATRTRAPPA